MVTNRQDSTEEFFESLGDFLIAAAAVSKAAGKLSGSYKNMTMDRKKVTKED